MIRRWLRSIVNYLFGEYLDELRGIRQALERLSPPKRRTTLEGMEVLRPVSSISGIKIFNAME